MSLLPRPCRGCEPPPLPEWECTLSEKDKATLDARIAALPPLPDDALDEIALILDGIRADRATRAACRKAGTCLRADQAAQP